MFLYIVENLVFKAFDLEMELLARKKEKRFKIVEKADITIDDTKKEALKLPFIRKMRRRKNRKGDKEIPKMAYHKGQWKKKIITLMMPMKISIPRW